MTFEALAPRGASTPSAVTSSYCTGGQCVGVRFDDTGVDVVDTSGAAPALRFTHEEWAAFVAGVKDGEFDLAE